MPSPVAIGLRIASLLVLAALLSVAACRKNETTVVEESSSEVKPSREKPAKPELPAKSPPPDKPREASERARMRKPNPNARTLAKSPLSSEQARLNQQRLQLLRDRSQNDRASATSAELASDLLQTYQAATDADARIEALNGLAGRDEPEVRQALAQAATEAADAERIAALEMLADMARPECLPIAAAALDSPNADVQTAGLWLLRHIASEAALPVWARAIHHDSVEVTQTAMELLSEAPAFLQVPVAKQALARNQPWLTEEALNLLSGTVSKPAVEALIPYIEHPVSGDLAQSGLFFLLGEHFDTAQDAQAWWQANQQRLDTELQPLELR